MICLDLDHVIGSMSGFPQRWGVRHLVLQVNLEITFPRCGEPGEAITPSTESALVKRGFLQCVMLLVMLLSLLGLITRLQSFVSTRKSQNSCELGEAGLPSYSANALLSSG